MNTKRIVAIMARWLTSFAMGLWLGGILFLGAVTAPQIFRFLRAHDVEPLAPQLFGLILARFSIVALACGVLTLIAWLADGLVLKPIGKGRLLWSGQGICIAAMLLVSVYLQFGALPQLLRNQDAVIAESAKTGITLSARGTEGKSEMRLRYDALHNNYTSLTMVIFWLGAASLAALIWRLSLAEDKRSIN